MPKKRTVALVIILAFGIIAIPGGFLIKNVIQNLVFNNVDYALLEMRSRAGPLVEPIVNATISANGMNIINEVYGLGALFNDSSIVSSLAWHIDQKFGTGDLNYSSLAQDRIAYGNHSDDPDSPYYLPGILADLDQGTGLTAYLALYETAITDPAIKSQMLDAYNCSWEYLGYIKDYYYNYCIGIVPNLIASGYVSDPAMGGKAELQGFNTTLQIADFYFLQQWCNGSRYPCGYPLPLVAGDVYGFEIGYQNQTTPIVSSNITRAAMYQLWNESNPYSLVTDEGLSHWWNIGAQHSEHYNTTRDANYLTDAAVDAIVAWLPRFLSDLMPYLAQEAYSLPTDTTTIGNIIQIGGAVLGASLIGLVAVLYLKKRRKE